MTAKTGSEGMTLVAGSVTHVLAAGLAFAAGYGAAAYAGASRSDTAEGRAPAVFGVITSAWDVASEGVAPGIDADATLALEGHTPRAIGERPLRSGAKRDTVSRDRIQFASLAWAPPAVPRPLTVVDGIAHSAENAPVVHGTPLPPPLSAAVAMIEGAKTPMPVVHTLAERMGLEGIGAALLEHSPLLGARRRLSEPGRLPMSRSRGMDQAYSHAGDPLAALPLEEEVAVPVPARAPAPDFIMPFANGRVTSLFNQGRRHPAIDLAGKLGSPVLITTVRQKVTFAGWRGGYGNAVITIDDFGRTHLYGHLQRITTRVGAKLIQGDQVGHLGSTGRSTGPHVHYEVKNAKGVHINPVTLLFPGRGVSKGYAWADVGQERVLAKLATRLIGQRPPRADANPSR